MTAAMSHAGTDHANIVTVVIVIRLGDTDGIRARNLSACLAGLRRQNLPKSNFRIIVVEQDEESRWERTAMPSIDTHVFIYNPGPFNRGWAFNVGARTVSSGVLCLLDADLLLPPAFLLSGLAAWREGALAIRPYNEVVYMGSASTTYVLARLAEDGEIDFFDPNIQGGVQTTLEGGCSWIDVSLYHRINGHDERFAGWGHEDREFSRRLSTVTSILTLPGRLLHLNHPRAESLKYEGRANLLLYRALMAGLLPPQRGPIGDVHRYRQS